MPTPAPDANEVLGRFRDDVQAALDTFIAEHRPAVETIATDLAPTMDALVDFLSGGKRLRPAFCYWGYLGARGRDAASALRAAAALELLQASALIHDDVMDNSDTRRGQPSIHRRFEALHAAAGWQGSARGFGDAAAILIGDLALVWADTMFFANGMSYEALGRAKPFFDNMRTELMAGQFLDVLEQARGGGDTQRAIRVMRYKTTAYTIERPLHLGAALAGAGNATIDAYTRFGTPLGEAFQLRDDLLGVFGDPEATGKPAGDDLREGKRTVLIALAQERATHDDQAHLQRLIGDASLSHEGVAEAREILVRTGARDEVEARILTNREAALAALDSPAISEDAASMLAALAIASTDRTS